MKTIVLGAGAVGVATAYWLRERGHEVTVIERREGAALETSFGNGAVIHASEVEPWAQPGMPWKVLKWLGDEGAPLLLRPRALPHMWRWGLSFARNCTPDRFAANSLANLRLALLSLECLQGIRARTGIEYDCATRGVLKIYRDDASYDAARRRCDALARHGLTYRAVAPDECARLEPALAETASTLVGGLHFEKDEVGDCHKFTQGLARHLAAHGVEFRYGETITGLVRDGARVTQVTTASGAHRADAMVVAMGSFTPLLLRGVGIRVPIYPVKGVSVTLPGNLWAGRVRMPVIDDSRLFGLIPIGERVRVAGSAEIDRYDDTPNPVRARAIVDNVIRTFPGFGAAYRPEAAQIWAGLRPVTPPGVAYMGRTPLANLFVNAGHGHLGWTMACGAGRVAADIVSGEPPPIDLTRFPRLAGS
jgi:D-amino-acid dehydrogenase